MSVKNIIAEQKLNVDLINRARKEIAVLKKDKIIKRAKAWENATGTAKEKEDYVRSVVAEIDLDIQIKEANIEYWFNMNKILNCELEHMTEDE